MLRCTPFLLFDGNCAQAMTFYHDCLGGALTLTKLGDTPMKDMLPAAMHGRVINAVVKAGVIEISASDWMASLASSRQRNLEWAARTCWTKEAALFDSLADRIYDAANEEIPMTRHRKQPEKIRTERKPREPRLRLFVRARTVVKLVHAPAHVMRRAIAFACMVFVAGAAQHRVERSSLIVSKPLSSGGYWIPS